MAVSQQWFTGAFQRSCQKRFAAIVQRSVWGGGDGVVLRREDLRQAPCLGSLMPAMMWYAMLGGIRASRSPPVE